MLILRGSYVGTCFYTVSPNLSHQLIDNKFQHVQHDQGTLKRNTTSIPNFQSFACIFCMLR